MSAVHSAASEIMCKAADMADYGKEVRKLLREAGWQFLRKGKGDHEIWWDPLTGKKVTVDKVIKSRHTANGITSQARLGKRF